MCRACSLSDRCLRAWQCRIGRAGQGFPDFAVPTVVAEGVPKRVYVGDAYIGATKRHAQLSSTRLPIRRGEQQ